MDESEKVRLLKCCPGSCYDLSARTRVKISAGGFEKVPLGAAFQIPQGYIGRLELRSSLGCIPLLLTCGVIDASFRGEVYACIFNASKSDVVLEEGERIVQIVVMKDHMQRGVDLTDKLDESIRGHRAFGSSGRFHEKNEHEPALFE